ncbi:MAG: carbohydrate ABC transporter permease [Lachnospiraceae bacterium]
MSGLTTRKKKILKQNAIGYSFILPNLIGYGIFVFLPVCFSLVLSLMEWDGSKNPMKFVGLQNFVQIFGDEVFRQSFAHTLTYAIMTVPITLVLSLLLAVLLNSKLKGIAVFRTAYFFPYVASLVAVGAVWNLLFQPDFGPINEFLKFIGMSNPPRWIASTKWAMVSVVIVSIWKYMGYYMIVYLAALQGINSSLYEAASIDGANAREKLRYITIPMLTPTTFFVLIMLTIQCFKVFDLIYVMTGGGPGNSTKVLVNYIYEKAFVSWQFGTASAAAMVLFAVVLVITLIQFRGEKKWVSYM